MQYKNTMLTKLQSLIAGDEKALIYITDSESYKYLEGISDSTSIFEGEPLAFGEDFYKSTETENFGALPEGLQVSCRRVSDTVLESKKNIKPLYNAAKNLIEKLSDLN